MQLLGHNTLELENVLREMNQAPFRGRQLAAWLYRRSATGFAQMSDLSGELRAQLAEINTKLAFPK